MEGLSDEVIKNFLLLRPYDFLLYGLFSSKHLEKEKNHVYLQPLKNLKTE
jgi:hypothetical protein